MTSADCSYHAMTDDERACLQERKYWCFLLSSIVTFCVSMLFVVTWKLLQAMFCASPVPSNSAVAAEADEKCVLATHSARTCITDSKMTAEEKQRRMSDDEGPRIGWVTEAKDWAGELISGQSFAGRCLVENRVQPTGALIPTLRWCLCSF
jgi:potassium large conductance calcium-activated channel subfamily M alpha protein 1